MLSSQVHAESDYLCDPTPLRVYRVAAGLTQAGLAARAGLTRITVSALERGENAPRLATAQALSRALNTDVSALFPPMTDGAGTDSPQQEIAARHGVPEAASDLVGDSRAHWEADAAARAAIKQMISRAGEHPTS